MISYKLIKEYPKSPKLFTIESYEDRDNISQEWNGTEFYDANPEFWEKVEELDYEIIKSCPIEGTIYSVKRLSDGEVFTIGDIIDFEYFGNKGFQKIERFEVDFFDNTRITAYESAYGLGIIMWKKAPVKTLLFTTEDGVEIFNGDDFFVIETQFGKYRLHKTIGGHFTKERSTRLRFHSKEKAEEYVLLNKPCLSIMEVAPIFGQMHLDNSHDVLTRNLAKLKSLVQAKL